MKVLRGQAISPGYARGVAAIHSLERDIPVPRTRIEHSAIPEEYQRFDDAIERASKELEHVRDRVLSEFGAPQSEIFEAHLALLNDPYFIKKVKDRVASGLINVEQAVEAELEVASQLLASSKDEYFHERAQDIRDVGRRVLRQLAPEYVGPLRHLPPHAVIVARELLPSDTVYLDRSHLAAIITERGGATGHTAIMARSMGIPAITALAGATDEIPANAQVLVNGETGEVIVNPSPEEFNRFTALKQRYDATNAVALAWEAQECVTHDGVHVHLYANIGRMEELLEVHRHHLEGVGLFRTEFLFMHDSIAPGLDRQVEVYQKAIQALNGKPLVIRTIDLGGDKTPDFLRHRYEANPLLGLRGLRYAMTDALDLFQTQLSALVRAGAGSSLKVMFPMVLGSGDLRQAIEVMKAEAALAGIDSLPSLGAMVETPSSLFTLDRILDVVDFVSIGTNDLTQFLLATDRNAVEHGGFYSTLHPAVLRAIHRVAVEADRRGKPVTVCGEVAGEPKIACLLLGLGIRHLSMSPMRAPRVRFALRNVHLRDMEELAARAMECELPDQVEALLEHIKTQ